MTSSVPRIANTALQKSVDDVLMQVDRDTVLTARAVLMQEADELEEAMRDATVARVLRGVCPVGWDRRARACGSAGAVTIRSPGRRSAAAVLAVHRRPADGR